MEPIIPLALAGAALWAYLASKKTEAAPSGPATVTPEDLETLTEVRDTPQGPARFFRDAIAAQVLTRLDAQTLEVATVTGVSASDAAAWRVIDGAGSVTAKQAVLGATGSGLSVIGSISLPLVAVEAERVLLFTQPANRARFAPGSGTLWAVLVDPTMPGPVTEYPDDYPPEFKNRTDEELGGTPFRIRAAASDPTIAVDLPSQLSVHYVNVAGPSGPGGLGWAQILDIPYNQDKWGMGSISTWFESWPTGQWILLPLDWNVRSKKLPRPLGFSPSASQREEAEQIYGPDFCDAHPEDC